MSVLATIRRLLEIYRELQELRQLHDTDTDTEPDRDADTAGSEEVA